MDNQDQPTQNVTGPTVTQPAPVKAEETKILTKSEKLKRSFFQILIGCLLGSAAIAVIAVLFGSFNEVLGRSLGTIGMVALHALLAFSYVNETEKKDKKDGGRSIDLFSNTMFVLIVVSFITSVFAIWDLLPEGLTLKLYMAYFVIIFATLHADVLYRIRGFEKKIDTIVTTNYFFMTAVVLMLFVIIFSADPSDLGGFYFRLLAAVGIIDATMSITAIIMQKLHLQKLPELANDNNVVAASGQSRNLWKNPLVILLIIFLGFQIVGGVVALIIASAL